MNISFNKNQYWLTPITKHTAMMSRDRISLFYKISTSLFLPCGIERELYLQSIRLSLSQVQFCLVLVVGLNPAVYVVS